MKLNVKTLDGKNFSIDIEESKTFAEVKDAIAEARPDLPADTQKLIHAGKILKDDQTLAEVNIGATEFIVCMSKPKKPARASPAPAPAPAAAPAPAPAAAPVTPAPAQPATPAAPERPAGEAAATNTSTPAQSNYENPETVQQLVDMGFPEDQVKAALRAAMGNGDVAVEFLMNGIPEGLPTNPAAAGASSGGAAASTGTGHPLDALRRHPQLNALKRLVQSNPGALQQVLQQIGAQSPELLATIHANQEEFVRMMNEPVDESAPAATAAAAPAGAGATGAAAGGMGGMGGMGGGMNPAIMARMMQLASLPEAQRAQVAQSLGIPADQLNQFVNLMRMMPPEQLQQIMAAGMGGGGGMGGGLPPGATTIRLTQDEADAVNRLCDMGFNRNNVMQAYLACDKNEAMAANLLMDGMGFDDDDADVFAPPAQPAAPAPPAAAADAAAATAEQPAAPAAAEGEAAAAPAATAEGQQPAPAASGGEGAPPPAGGGAAEGAGGEGKDADGDEDMYS